MKLNNYDHSMQDATPKFFFKQMLLFFVTCLVMIISRSSYALVWNLKKLNGVQVFHAGPNCISGALLEPGIVNKLTYIDSLELRYILENYCTQTDKPVQGNILIVERENTIEHAAIYLNNDYIFEKHNTAGFYKHYENIEDIYYKIIKKNESEYFTEDQDRRTIKSFSCEGAQSIHLDLEKKCEKTNVLELINAIRSKFELVSLNKNAQIEESDIPVFEINQLINEISSLRADDECSMYAVSVGISTFGSLYQLIDESDSNKYLLQLKVNLKAKITILFDEIQKIHRDQKTKKILNEAKSWGFNIISSH